MSLAEIVAGLPEAQKIVYRTMPPTPQYRWPLLSDAVGTDIWVKHENHTPVGAFKVRGGLVYFDALKRREPNLRGVVTATRGNHGQSVGLAARQAGLDAVVVVPLGNSREKNAAMRALGVELVEEGVDFQAAREAAERLATERNLHMVPSFHTDLVRGVASYGVELLTAVPDLDVVYVPIGMGSGICGMIAARRFLNKKTEIVCVVSSHAPAYALSLQENRVVEHPSTTLLADGMACRKPDAEALEIMRGQVSHIVAVSDTEVAGAASLAAVRQERERLEGKRVGVILCGGNVDSDVFASILRAEGTHVTQ